MLRNRRLTALIFLVLPLLVWSLGAWGQAGSSTNPLANGQVRPADPDPTIQGIMDQVTREEFTQLDTGLSGDVPITIGGQQVTLTTRYTPSSQGTLAEQYVYEYFQSLGYTPQYDPWSRCSTSGRNVIAEIPGTLDPSRIYLLTGHLDTISPNPTTNAKGADDDGSGTVAVMMAARILSGYSFDYTVRFVAFTGEERGLCGSAAYAAEQRAINANIQGVINLDMIAYDSNNIKDVEIHAGTIPASQTIANLLIQNISTYNLNLVPHLHTTDATRASDHASFWNNNYPALLGIEYYMGGDFNPWYHSYTCCDTMAHVDLAMAQDFTKVGIGTLSQLAVVHTPTGGTPTVVPPTNTAVPPTNTPVPPTDTPVAATNTPEPQATDTLVPPTSTAVAPTNTPEPLATATTQACTFSFSDVHPTDYFYDGVRYLYCNGAITGYSDGTFQPYADSTRGQLAKIVVLAEGWPIDTAGGPHFSDVPESNPFYPYIETIYNHTAHVIGGYSDGTFRPGNFVTRGQLAKIVVISEGWSLDTTGGPHFSDVPQANPFYSFVETAHNRGIISGYADGTFRWGNNVTRGQLSKIVYGAVTQP